jgi:hypothetical protein
MSNVFLKITKKSVKYSFLLKPAHVTFTFFYSFVTGYENLPSEAEAIFLDPRTVLEII